MGLLACVVRVELPFECYTCYAALPVGTTPPPFLALTFHDDKRSCTLDLTVTGASFTQRQLHTDCVLERWTAW